MFLAGKASCLAERTKDCSWKSESRQVKEGLCSSAEEGSYLTALVSGLAALWCYGELLANAWALVPETDRLGQGKLYRHIF